MPARIRVRHRFSQPERDFVRDFPSNCSCDTIFASQGIVSDSREKHKDQWRDSAVK